MRKTVVTLVALVAGLLIASPPVAAHHGAAAFENDPAKRLVLKGVVTQWIWANPVAEVRYPGDGMLAERDGVVQQVVCESGGWNRAVRSTTAT